VLAAGEEASPVMKRLTPSQTRPQALPEPAKPAKPAKPEGYDDLLQSFMQMYDREKAERYTALAYPEYTGIKLPSGPFSAVAQQQQRCSGFGVAAQLQPRQQSFGQSAFGVAAQQQPQQHSFGQSSSTPFVTAAQQQPYGQNFGMAAHNQQPAYGVAAQQQPQQQPSGLSTAIARQQPTFGTSAQQQPYGSTFSMAGQQQQQPFPTPSI